MGSAGAGGLLAVGGSHGSLLRAACLPPRNNQETLSCQTGRRSKGVGGSRCTAIGRGPEQLHQCAAVGCHPWARVLTRIQGTATSAEPWTWRHDTALSFLLVTVGSGPSPPGGPEY